MPGKRLRRTRLAIAADHNGVALKRALLKALRGDGYPVRDLGAYNRRPADYPDVARRVGEAILSRRADLGILICGSGVGASVAANKMPGIRAGLCQDAFSARQGREDDDTNVLCLGAFVVGERLALELVRRWLGARFSGAARHRRRLRKIEQLERDAARYQAERRS